MKEALKSLFSGRHLSRSDARRAMDQLIRGECSVEQIAAFLGALRSRGETMDEIVGFAEAIRDKAVRVQTKRKDLVDTCGTGGDGADTFNISTAVSFVVAGAGLGVAKHGNRSVSSRCGSADVLEALGVPIDHDATAAAKRIDEKNYAFLFAPLFHPGLRHAGPIRKALGVRTVFNLLGPLVNPAGVLRQVVGVYDRSFVMTIARVLQELGSEEAMVVCSEEGMDEISLQGATLVAHLKNGRVKEYSVSASDAGLGQAPSAELRGGDAAENARIVRSVLDGSLKGPKRDVVVLNAAAALMVSGNAKDLREGAQIAAEIVDKGHAASALEAAK